MRKLVSVVVPVYNTGKYLRHCLESLANQTIGQGLEVILVDDGSTDWSGEMCDEYAAKYPAIFQVIHKANGGSASAREAGWQVATGEFITVCDSDDWVEPQMYERMYAVASESGADMVICDMFYNYADGSQVIINQDYGTDMGSEAIIAQVLKNNTFGSTCSKLSRRRFFQELGLHWEPGINLGEDALMLLKYLKFARPKTVKIDDCLYHYRRRRGETTYTNALTLEKWQQLARVHRWKEENLTEPIYSDGLLASAIDLIFAYLRLPEGNMPVTSSISVKQILQAPSPLLKRGVVLCAKTMGVRPTRALVKMLYSLFYK